MANSFRIEGRQFVLDTLIGLSIISLALVAIVGGTSPAGALESTVLHLAEDRWLPLATIAAMFSLFLAFNLALYRHVRRVYADEQPRNRRSARHHASYSKL